MSGQKHSFQLNDFLDHILEAIIGSKTIHPVWAMPSSAGVRGIRMP
jgi:hypothetical protein